MVEVRDFERDASKGAGEEAVMRSWRDLRVEVKAYYRLSYKRRRAQMGVLLAALSLGFNLRNAPLNRARDKARLVMRLAQRGL